MWGVSSFRCRGLCRNIFALQLFVAASECCGWCSMLLLSCEPIAKIKSVFTGQAPITVERKNTSVRVFFLSHDSAFSFTMGT